MCLFSIRGTILGMDRYTENDRKALAMFNQVKLLKARSGQDGATYEPMLAEDPKTGEANYDLSKADPTCELCHGKGYRAQLYAANGQVEQLTIICRCVAKRGGVKERDDARG